MASDGSIDKVAGTEAVAQSEVRNAAGGPPYIPVNDIEIGQIRVSGGTAAVVSVDEIFQVIGQHSEAYDSPTWDENNVGDGEAAEASAQKKCLRKIFKCDFR